MLLLALACIPEPVPTPVDTATWPDIATEEVGPATQSSVSVSPAGQVFSEELTLTLESTIGVDIVYTLDGSEPGSRDDVYSEPITLDESTQVRAVALDIHGDPFGEPIAASYVRVSDGLSDFSSNLPVLVLSSPRSLPESKAELTSFSLQVHTPGDDGRTHLQAPDQDLRAGLKVRGSSSAGYPKKPYALELWSAEDDEDQADALLGMPAESDWVLLAPLNFDRALIRNALSYQLSRDVGRYAPRTRFVELFAVGSDGELDAASYKGVYVLVERIKRDTERVDIQELGPQDSNLPELSGGYLFKEDRTAEDESGFTAGTAGGTFDFQQPFVAVDPKEAELSFSQARYLTDTLDTLGESLAAPDFQDPESGIHYSEQIDQDAWIDHHILNTLPKNPDAFRLSGYFYKDREGPIVAGPLWDFDRTMGCEGDSRAEDPTWWDPSNQTTDTTYIFEHGFWLGLFADPEFQDAYWARWVALLQAELALDRILDHVQSMEAELSEAAARNFVRWPDYPPRGGSYAAEVNVLEQWLTARHRWISRCVERENPQNCTGNWSDE
ncbi:MAG: hypothetical protein ACI9VR_003561 [Cognaticolwellia sp.]|jgi:hypothetical protein